MNPPTTPGLALRPYFDPFDPALHTDPYVRYAAVREAAAVGEGPHNLVVVTRHADVSHALRDNRLGHGPLTAPNRIFSFLGMDPPDHGPLRRLASRFFAPAAIGSLAPRITAVVDELLDRALEKRHVDLLTDFAYPLSLRVVCGLFALPEHEQPWIREQTPPIARLLDPPYALSDGDRAAAHRAAGGFVAYLHRKINERRQNPGPDALSALIAEADTGATPERRTLLPMCALLLMAGYETTANLIANGVLALLRHPDQLNTARGRARSGDGRLDGRAMNELLRYDPSIQITFRTVQRPAVVAGVPMDPGSPVALLIGSANHDPRVFTRPERLDVDRGHNPHLSFGAGIHYCLGAPLARLEASLALGRLLARTRRIEPGPGPVRHKDTTATIRGVEALPVTLTAA
ncbi:MULTISPECIES: cytochrome P450 [unclassified Streptomyces]|uniref:cytochrome P450 n=1 Tax=unclassified Streptomyces TaxID=2593676 RepID=UPI002ED561EB|nr:cytochrome P450 [Streptomyces sp. NBC_00891]WSY03556.1 cytochrome P450 [Streptomyces sp. NBC_00890]WSZ05183.1 cytochrome P450 [Streptomyces sp. NBC_00869]WSZ27322.1 cytochrome P450 [Streptomyces sp. NBC_00870]